MQGDKGKTAIVSEAARVLRPGGRYAIHELGVTPDDIDQAYYTELRKDLARAIHVNARPMTAAAWKQLLQDAGLEVEWVGTAPMALLAMRRNLYVPEHLELCVNNPKTMMDKLYNYGSL